MTRMIWTLSATAAVIFSTIAQAQEVSVVAKVLDPSMPVGEVIKEASGPCTIWKEPGKPPEILCPKIAPDSLVAVFDVKR